MTDDAPAKDRPEGRALRLEVDLDAPPDAVWRAWTDAGELSRWFPVTAEVEPGEGGSIFLSWGPGVEGRAPITGWEPGRRLQWTEQMPPAEEGGEPVRIAVEVTIEAREGGRSRLRLVQSGFGEGDMWDDYYDGLERGWSYFLWNLGVYLRHHAGTPRELVWLRRRGGAPREEVWRRLLGPEGFGVAGGDVAVPAAGEPWSLRLDGAAERGTVHMAAPAAAFAGSVDTLGDATFFVEFEGGGEGWHCGIYLSTWGLQPERVAALRRAVEEAADRVLAPAS